MPECDEPQATSSQCATNSPAVESVETHKPKEDHLQAIPPELRLMIYNELMPMAIERALRGDTNLVPTLLQTSRLLRKEAFDIWLKYVCHKAHELAQAMGSLLPQQDAALNLFVVAITTGGPSTVSECKAKSKAIREQIAEVQADQGKLRLMLGTAAYDMRTLADRRSRHN